MNNGKSFLLDLMQIYFTGIFASLLPYSFSMWAQLNILGYGHS